ALDAGAASVRVEVSGAGRAALRVNDDGCGMSAEDCVLALERHATSKIAALDDLERLSTFGFRGEALYAAAAVSRLSLSSCPRRAAEGFRVESEGGKLARSGPAAAVAGTTVEARDLFYNTPARLKFLKSDAYERSRLASVLEEAALANPEVRFDYKSEGRQLLHFAAETSPDPLERQRRRCAAVLGPELSEDLLPVLGDRPGYRLRLWLGAPDRLASTRRFQHWFVNRRPIDSRLLQQALYRAYGERRPREKHPVCVAYLELPPDAFDVNVHPGKREVRFHKERDLFELVCGLAAAALASRRPEPILLERGEGAGTPSLLADAPRPSESGERFPRFQEQTLALSSRPAEMVVADGLAQAWWTPPYRFLGQIERSY
ncbi:MAG: DNA mismatch repair protein MutL, partial [Elusimicrobia bacterium]|nr:DNA mismatch repair protein MutL [Elusimicrobiota bacterium]